MIEFILGFLGMILYPLFSFIFMLIDLLEDIFYKLAGVGNVSVNGVNITAGNTGADTDNGLIFYLLTTDVIRNLFISILLLAIFLIVIFTVMAFIRNSYTAKPKKWQEIIVAAFKGIANFIFIPIMCLLGVWVGNILLNAINGATMSSTVSSLSGQLFTVSAYNANKVRNGEMSLNTLSVNAIVTKGTKVGVEVDDNKKSGEVYDVEYYAGKVDEIFAQKGTPKVTFWDIDGYYSSMGINYIVLAGGGIIMLNILISISFGMVKRLIYLLALVVISPAACALFPLDDGAAVGSWKKQFISQTIGAYSAIAGMNLMFCLLPLVQKIDLGIDNWLGLTSFLLTIAALYMVKDIISLVNGFVGGENALSAGGELRKSATGMASKVKKKITSKAAGMGKAAFRAGGYAHQVSKQNGGKGASTFFKQLGKSAGLGALNSVPGGKSGKETFDAFRTSIEEGGKAYIAKNKKAEDKSAAKIEKDNVIASAKKLKEMPDMKADKAMDASGMPDKVKDEAAKQVLAEKKDTRTVSEYKKDSSAVDKAEKAMKEQDKEIAKKEEMESIADGSALKAMADKIGTSVSNLLGRLKIQRDFTDQEKDKHPSKANAMAEFGNFIKKYQEQEGKIKSSGDALKEALKTVMSEHTDIGLRTSVLSAMEEVKTAIEKGTSVMSETAAPIADMRKAVISSNDVQKSVLEGTRKLLENADEATHLLDKANDIAEKEKKS